MTEPPALLVRGIAAVVMRPMWQAAVLAAVACLGRVLTRRWRVRGRRTVVPALLVTPVCRCRLLVAIALPVLGLSVLRRRCAGRRAWYLPMLTILRVLLLLCLVAMLPLVLAWRRGEARGVLGRVVGGGCARGLGAVGGLGVVPLRRRLVLRGCAWRLVCGGRRGATIGSCLAGIRVPVVLVLQRVGHQVSIYMVPLALSVPGLLARRRTEGPDCPPNMCATEPIMDPARPPELCDCADWPLW